jgi:hypothetical protein
MSDGMFSDRLDVPAGRAGSAQR